MDLSSAAECIRHGADGVAVVRGLLQTEGPEESEARARVRSPNERRRTPNFEDIGHS